MNPLIVRTTKRMSDMPLMAERTFVGIHIPRAIFGAQGKDVSDGVCPIRMGIFSRTGFSSCVTLRGHRRTLVYMGRANG
jgi:hypothetical protein